MASNSFKKKSALELTAIGMPERERCSNPIVKEDCFSRCETNHRRSSHQLTLPANPDGKYLLREFGWIFLHLITVLEDLGPWAGNVAMKKGCASDFLRFRVNRRSCALFALEHPINDRNIQFLELTQFCPWAATDSGEG